MEEDAAREAEGTPARNSPDPPSSPSAVVLEAEPYALMLSTGWREPWANRCPGRTLCLGESSLFSWLPSSRQDCSADVVNKSSQPDIRLRQGPARDLLAPFPPRCAAS